jgi:hypothetical protein
MTTGYFFPDQHKPPQAANFLLVQFSKDEENPLVLPHIAMP